MDKMFKYSTPNLDNFAIQLGGKTISAKDKVLTLTEDQNNELQELLASGRPDIAQHVFLIDAKAAEEVARKYIETHKPQAQSGAVSAPMKPNPADGGAVRPVEVSPPVGTNSRLHALMSGNKDHVLAEANKELHVIERKEIPVVEEAAFHNEDTSKVPPVSAE